jgi:membrane-bound metal-dependent hydrolase YbcI (DUF457 family)
MTLNGHIKTGLALAVVWVFIAPGTFDISQQWILGTALIVMLGALAPDFIEFGIIPHRTLTHYWPIYALIILVVNPGYTQDAVITLLDIEEISINVSAAATAFCVGAVSHILMDLPFYGGAPLFRPFKKVQTLGLVFDGGYNNTVENIASVGIVSVGFFLI